jgi:hypothetical protein
MLRGSKQTGLQPSAFGVRVPPLLIGWLSHAHCDSRPISPVPGAWASRHFRSMALAVDGDSQRSSTLRAIHQSPLNSRQTDWPRSSYKFAVTVRGHVHITIASESDHHPQ